MYITIKSENSQIKMFYYKILIKQKELKFDSF